MDEKAREILFAAYWGPGGWRSGKVSAANFAYARKHGLMFDKISVTHDSLVKATIKARDAVPLRDLARAFLASLSTRLLYLRSAIASYANCSELKPHRFTPHEYPDMKYLCGECGATKKESKIDLNVLNFERIKWGGVRHEDLTYNMFDLQQFAREEIPKPNDEDVAIFKKILKTIDSSAAADHPGTLEKRLNGVLPANKDERRTLLEILACLGVLSPTRYDRPSHGKSDWSFVEDWRGEDSYDRKRVKQLFGKYL